LMFNLRKNQKLAGNVAAGHLAPSDLVVATADELASDEILSKRKEIQEATLKDRVLKESLDITKRDSYHTEKSKVLNFEDLSRSRKGMDVDYDITTDAVLPKRRSGSKRQKSRKRSKRNGSKNSKRSGNGKEEKDGENESDPESERDSHSDSNSNSSDDSDDDVVIAANLKKKENEEEMKKERIEAKKKDIGLMLSQSMAANLSKTGSDLSDSGPSTTPSHPELTQRVSADAVEEAKAKSVEVIGIEAAAPTMVIGGGDDDEDSMSDDAVNDDDINRVTVIGEEDDDVILTANGVGIGETEHLNVIELGDDHGDGVGMSMGEMVDDKNGNLNGDELSDENDPFLDDDDHLTATAIPPHGDTATATTKGVKTEPESEVEIIGTTIAMESSLATDTMSSVAVPPRTASPRVSRDHRSGSKEKRSPRLLWKGKIVHNEALNGNEEQNELCFGIKIYQIGGESICRLPGFASPEDSKKGKKKRNSARNEMVMTGRIEHFELERYLLKSMQKESRRLICCKMTISKEVEEAQKLIKHLKNKERCARFKVGSKRNGTFFDFYIVPPTKSNRYLNHQFVAQHFGANITSKKMWAVIVLPIQSFNSVHSKLMAHSQALHQKSRSKSKAKSMDKAMDNGHSKGGGQSNGGGAGAAESVLDDNFLSLLDGLGTVLGDGNTVNANDSNTDHQAPMPQVVEIPSDPRKRR